ncbi:hypothetical protein JCM17844_25700 [Iodidimonas gelatinilytica]|uniref:histidine kinase n=1 Tax=Iodidimonas gelatinilytica TaxID=1236966 RepID=A0A5A7MUD9_9PROT|nr:HAMP domain-containing sensor histidine kinase [Iodidimonas gelatinilytica]GEQ98933.1 hypothetical protein JCM17844_25700 [Iodidimonas gelatinilytica]
MGSLSSVRSRLFSIAGAIFAFTLVAIAATHIQKDGGILHRLSYQHLRDVTKLTAMLSAPETNQNARVEMEHLAHAVKKWGEDCTFIMDRPVGAPLRLLSAPALREGCAQTVHTADKILAALGDKLAPFAKLSSQLPEIEEEFAEEIHNIDTSVNSLNSRLVIALTSLLWVSGLITALYSAGAALFVARHLGRLHNGVGRLAGGDLNAHISGLHRKDEFGDLARTLDQFRKSAQELKEAREEAESASRSKSQFLAVMSHELRTPLNAIIGFSELIKTAKESVPHATLRTYASYVLDSGKSLLELIGNLLDISKIEAGRYEMREAALDPHELALETLKAQSEKAEQKNLSLALNIEHEPLRLWAERRALRIILINLLDNAIKFSPEDTVITLRARLKDGHYHMELTDHGIGIPKNAQDLVFEPFLQIEKDLDRSAAGTGTGLPLVRRLMALHGGKAWLHSVPGKGTTACLCFPQDRVLCEAEKLAQPA